jgi:predicted transcriptional regulator
MKETGVKMETKIRDLTSRGIVGADRNDSLATASTYLAANEVGALVVYDSRGAAGVFSERDLVQAVADGANLDETRIRDYMTLAPVRINLDSTLEEGIAKMSDLGVRHLVVVKDGEIVGMVSARDILRALRKRGRQERSAGRELATA